MDLFGTGGMFRSADMEYVSLIIAEHLAHDVLSRLGEIGVTQFTDVRCDSERLQANSSSSSCKQRPPITLTQTGWDPVVRPACSLLYLRGHLRD